MMTDTKLSKPKKKQPRDFVKDRLAEDDARMAAPPRPETSNGDPAPARADKGQPVITEQQGTVHRIDLRVLVPTLLNPRFGIHEDRVNELMASMSNLGQLQFPIARRKHDPIGLELLTGRHRFEAAMRLGWKTMLIDVRELTDKEAVEIVTMDNIQRTDMHPLEEAIGITNMINAGFDLAGIAATMNKSEAWVARRRSLVSLSPKWQDAIRHPENFDTAGPYPIRNYIGRLSAAHYERVARLPLNVQEAKFDQIRQWFNGQMHDADHLGNRLHDGDRILTRAPFAKVDQEVVDELAKNSKTSDIPLCAVCPKQTGAAPLLFADDDSGKHPDKTRCLDGGCWSKKEAAFVKLRMHAACEKLGNVIPVRDSWSGVKPATSRLVKQVTDQPIMGPNDYTIVKKGDKGAQPAVVVDSGDVGKTVWVKVKKPQTATQAGGSDVESNIAKASLEVDRVDFIVNEVLDQLERIRNTKSNIGDVFEVKQLMAIVAFCQPSWVRGRIAADALFAKIKTDKVDLFDYVARTSINVLTEENWDVNNIFDIHPKAAESFLELFAAFPGEWDLKTLKAKALEAFPDPVKSTGDTPAKKPSKKATKKKGSKS